MSQQIQEDLIAKRKLRQMEAIIPLTPDEIKTAKAFIELLRKPVSLTKISSVMKIPSWRTHQIYQRAIKKDEKPEFKGIEIARKKNQPVNLVENYNWQIMMERKKRTIS